MRVISLIVLVFSSIWASAQNHFTLIVQSVSGERIQEFALEVESHGLMFSDTEGHVHVVDSADSLLIAFVTPGYEPWQDFVHPGSPVVIEVTPSTQELNTVEVSGSLTSEHGLHSESVDEDHLRERAANTLAESLDQIPGVQAVNTGVGISKPMIRGMLGTRVQVSDAGVIQEGQQWGMDHGLEIDQFAVERVEVVTGVATLQYGPAAQTGMVRILPSVMPSKGWHGEVGLMGKSNNRLIGQSTAISFRSGEHFLRARYTLQDFADYRVPADQFTYNGYVFNLPDGILKNTAGTEQNYRLEYGWNTAISSLRITGSRFHQKVGLFPGAMGIPRQYDISDIGDQRDVDLPYQLTIHDKLIANWSLFTSLGKWEVIAGYQHNHREERSKPHAHGLLYVDPSNTLGVGLDLRTYSGTVKDVFDWAHVHWTIGADVQFQDNRRSGWEYLLPDYRRMSYAQYLLGSYAWNSWNITAGLRLDESTVTVDGYSQAWYNQPDSLVARVVDFNRNYTAPSFSLGFTKHWNSTVVSIQASRVSRIPVVAELAANGVHHGTFRHEKGDANLDVEKGFTGEMSLQHELETHLVGLEFKATGYIYSYSNYIYLSPTGEFSNLPDAGQVYAYEQSAAMINGMEFHMATSEEKGVGASIDYETIFNSYNPSTGENLPFQPANKLASEIHYGISSWKVGVVGEYTFDKTNVAVNEPSTPGYFLLHLTARYEMHIGGHPLEIRFRLQNMTNQSYMRHISRYRILNLPEQGINGILQLSYSF